MYTKEQQKENRKKWVEALRSGKYEQGKYILAKENLSGTYSFCCLGVAAHILGEPEDLLSAYSTLRDLPDIMDAYGLIDDAGACYVKNTEGEGYDGCLAELNDDGFTFEEIADIIESDPKGLFRD